MYPNKEKSAIKKAKYRNKHFTPNNFSDSDGEEDDQWCPWRFLIFFPKVFRSVMFLMWKWCYPPPPFPVRLWCHLWCFLWGCQKYGGSSALWWSLSAQNTPSWGIPLQGRGSPEPDEEHQPQQPCATGYILWTLSTRYMCFFGTAEHFHWDIKIYHILLRTLPFLRFKLQGSVLYMS